MKGEGKCEAEVHSHDRLTSRLLEEREQHDLQSAISLVAEDGVSPSLPSLGTYSHRDGYSYHDHVGSDVQKLLNQSGRKEMMQGGRLRRREMGGGLTSTDSEIVSELSSEMSMSVSQSMAES